LTGQVYAGGVGQRGTLKVRVNGVVKATHALTSGYYEGDYHNTSGSTEKVSVTVLTDNTAGSQPRNVTGQVSQSMHKP
jgi:hypothetical protein